MSFLETGKGGFKWIETPLARSLPQNPGCAQCGTALEMDGRGRYRLSGKCLNCENRGSYDDDGFEDLGEF